MELTNDGLYFDPDQAERDALRLSEVRSQEVRKNEREDFWKRVLGDRVGREMVWELLISCHAFDTFFPCGPTGFPDPNAAFFMAGCQSIGLKIYRDLQVMDFDGIRLMHNENDPRFRRVETDGETV